MRRWMAAPLVFALALALASQEAPRARAQPPGAVEETFKTADGMELHGVFHATTVDASRAPVVVLLYPPGPDRDMSKGDWKDLTKMLNEKGYHVFRFDWRGHGKSTKITDKDKFWRNIYLNGQNCNFNAYIKGGPPKMPTKNDLSVKDLGTNANRYMPAYLNDLAAVRYYLDTKNDNKELNSSSIYIVGAGDAAGLGMAWLTTEWKRPAVMPTVNQLGFGATGYEFVPQQLRNAVFDEGGADFAGAVWLTATKPSSMPAQTIQWWVSNKDIAPKIRENNPMLFLYAEKDTAGAASGKRQSEFFFNEVLVADPKKGSSLEKLEYTFLREVKGGEQLQGLKLLGQNATLKTEDTILQYLAARQKDRQRTQSKPRKFDNPYFVDVRFFRLGP